MFRHISIPLLFLAAAAALSAQESWVWQNPKPTGLDLRAVSFPGTSGPGYAIGAGGTILRSEDDGATWVPEAGTDLAMDLHAASFPGGQAGFAVGSNGLFLRRYGQAWNELSPPTGHDLRGVSFVNDNTGWIAGYDGSDGIILKTTNGGTSWDIQLETTKRILAVHAFDGFIAYAAGHNGAFYYTTSGGAAWTEANTGTTATLRAIHFVNQDVGYVAGDDGTLLKTTTGGLGWTPLASGTTRNLTGVRFLDASTGWATGEGGLILRTTNGGTSWSVVQDGSANLNGIASRGNTVWAVGTAGRMLRSQNAGASWNILSNATSLENINALQFPAQGTGYAAGNGGLLLKTTNGGTTWTPLALPTNANLLALHFLDADTGHVGGANGTLLRTTNGGASWTTLSTGTSRTIRSVLFKDGKTGWFAGDSGTVRRTTNGGSSWQAPTTWANTNTNLNSLTFATPLVGWVGGGSVLRKTTDGGATWSNQSVSDPSLSNSNSVLVDLHAFDANHVVLLRGNGYHWTTNGGSNWTSGGRDNNALFRAMDLHPSGTGVLVTGNGRVATTSDSGRNWKATQVLSTGSNLAAVALAPNGTVFVGGNNGIILKQLPDPPSQLSYPSPLALARNTATPPVLPTYTGVVSHFTITPALPAGLAFNTTTGAISGTPGAGVSASTHTITAHNEGGSTSTQVTISVRNPITVFYYPQHEISLTRGSAMSPIMPTVGGEAPYAPVTFSVTPALPSGLSLNASTGAISGTPANAQAFAFYIVTASNGIAEFDLTDTLRIMVQVPPTDLSYPVASTGTTYEAGEAITPIVPSVTVVTGSALRFSIQPPLPPGLSIDSLTGVISGTPTRTTNSTDYVVTATSTAGSTTVTVRIGVLGPPAELNYPAVTLGVDVPANGVGNPSVQGAITHWSITPALPDGITFDTTSGRFHGTASEAQTGLQFTVTATNERGSTTGTVALNILNPIVQFSYPIRVFDLRADQPMPAISPIVAGTLPFTPVTYVVSPPLPAGLVLNATSGSVSGTPTGAGVQPATQHVITARNGVTAFNKTDTLTITVRPSVSSIRMAQASRPQGLRFGNRNLALDIPEAARRVDVVLMNLQGKVVASRSLELPGEAGQDLSADLRSGAGILVLRARFRNAEGAALGVVTTRVAALP